MITKLVVKDYVAKKCPYLTRSELEDKSLIDLIKKAVPLLNDLNEALGLESEEGDSDEGEASETVLDLTQVAKDYPHLKRDIKRLLEKLPKNNVERLVDKYNDDQLTSKLSRKYIEHFYGKENCRRCDVNGDGEEIINQDLIVRITEDALKDDSVKVLFEGQIEYENYRARFDVLVKNNDGTYCLYEVKGTNNICTHPKNDKSIDSKIKDKYLYDLLFQYFLYTKAGMVFQQIGFITTNENFVMKKLEYPTEDENELIRLFKFKTDICLKEGTYSMLEYIGHDMYFKEDGSGTQPSIERVIKEINEIANTDAESPKRKPECKKGPACPFLTMCFSDANDLNSIFKLTKWNLYGGNHKASAVLIENGIEKIKDIPDEFVEDKFPPTKNSAKGEKRICARYQIDFEKGKYQNKYLLDFKLIGEILNRDYQNENIDYLIFFDFESFQHPIPLVKDSHPWKQVVSQYSMHVCEKKYDITKHNFEKGIGGGITHFEYIGNPDIDGYDNPSFKLYYTLKEQLESIGIDVYANNYKVIVFNQNFEKTRMTEFTRDFGERVGPEMTRFVDNFNNNVVDLLDFFTYGSIYSRDFGGRGSLKVVQPALTTDPDVLKYYHSLELPFDFEYSLDYHKGDKCLVFNGAICLNLFKCLLIRHHLGEQNEGISTNDLLKEALAYCKIDSWGTVIIYDIIKNVFEGKIKLDALKV